MRRLPRSAPSLGCCLQATTVIRLKIGCISLTSSATRCGTTDGAVPMSIKAGLKPLGWHTLRRSYRTWLGEKGIGPEVQRDLMRHSTIAMSLDGYRRGVPEANRAANATA